MAQNPLPASITARAVGFIRGGMSVTDALRAAIDEEDQFILSLCHDGYYSKQRYRFIADRMAQEVYHQIRESK